MKFETKERLRNLIPWRLRYYWYDVRDFFAPRQRWLTKKIPNSWIDKDTLWELCILEGIKHYVEKDGDLGFDDDWRKNFAQSELDPTYPEWQKEFYREVFFNYEMITTILPELEAELEKAWKKVPHRAIDDICKPLEGTYEENYGEVNKLEKKIADLKTTVMVWAVKNREKIWT